MSDPAKFYWYEEACSTLSNLRQERVAVQF